MTVHGVVELRMQIFKTMTLIIPLSLVTPLRPISPSQTSEKLTTSRVVGVEVPEQQISPRSLCLYAQTGVEGQVLLPRHRSCNYIAVTLPGDRSCEYPPFDGFP